jgi:DNA replication protein DnaC
MPLKRVWRLYTKKDQFVLSEWDDRCIRTIQRSVRQASFRYKAPIEEIDFPIERGLDRNQVQRLAELSFISERKDLFVTVSFGKTSNCF